MVLLELEFEDSLKTIIEKFKIHGLTHEGPEISLSQQVLVPKHRAGEEMRTDYGRMVRICMDCDFGLGLHKYSLDDEQWQTAFYLQPVCQYTTFCLSRKRVLNWRSMGCRVSTLGILTTGQRTSKNPATLPFQAFRALRSTSTHAPNTVPHTANRLPCTRKRNTCCNGRSH